MTRLAPNAEGICMWSTWRWMDMQDMSGKYGAAGEGWICMYMERLALHGGISIKNLSPTARADHSFSHPQTPPHAPTQQKLCPCLTISSTHPTK